MPNDDKPTVPDPKTDEHVRSPFGVEEVDTPMPNHPAEKPPDIPQTPAAKPDQPTPDIDLPPVVVAAASSGRKFSFGGKFSGAKVATILGILVLIGGITAGIFLVRQQQELREEAFIPPEDITATIDCDGFKINIVESENVQCPQLDYNQCIAGTAPANNVSSYSSTWTITMVPIPGHRYPQREAQIKATKTSNYCPTSPCGTLENGQLHCRSNPTVADQTFTLGKNESKEITVTKDSLDGAACGSFQTFLKVEVLNCDAPENPVERDPTQKFREPDGFCQTGRVCGATPTPTTTATPTVTPAAIPTITTSPTVTATPTATPAATSAYTPGEPNSCGGTCGSNTNCKSDLYCYQGFCRNPSCPTDTDCACTTATPAGTGTPKPTQQAALPPAGIGAPTVIGIGSGLLLLFLSLAFAL